MAVQLHDLRVSAEEMSRGAAAGRASAHRESAARSA